MLQHRLEALADGADELEHQGIDASYLDEAANTLLEANVGMREARAKAASKAKDRGFQRPPSATASASARATASASGKGKGRGKGVCWDCGLEPSRKARVARPTRPSARTTTTATSMTRLSRLQLRLLGSPTSSIAVWPLFRMPRYRLAVVGLAQAIPGMAAMPLEPPRPPRAALGLA